MTPSLTVWMRHAFGRHRIMAQNVMNGTGIIEFNPQSISILPNRISKRNIHFTYTPDATDTTKGMYWKMQK